MWEAARLVLLAVCLLRSARPAAPTKNGNNNLLDKQVRTVDIQAVEGQSAELPLDKSTGHQDKLHMVLWFKDDAGVPIYSFDARGVGMAEGKHWSAPNVFGPRAHFRPLPQPAALVLKDVKRRDEGIYRCRIDYRNTQTTSFRYNLTVVVPPDTPIIVDSRGPVNETHMVPLLEGDNLVLNCRVLGGRPEPTVRWLVNGVLVDEEYEHNTGDVIENRLSWPAVGRQDLNSRFTCQAANSQLIAPRETSITLNIYLRPLTVDIDLKKINMPLTADRRYNVTCRTTGSRPHAVITWYKGKRQLKRAKDEFRDNMTISEMSFSPSTDDDGKPLTCRAENPSVSGLHLDTSWNLNVVYPPQVRLRLGSTLLADDIKEGDDVYFECVVHSNPPWRKLSWMHNGIILNHNITARIVRSNQSLVLQKVARHSGGKYTCSATNQEGETISDELDLRVKFSPMCRKAGPVAVGAARGEHLLVPCEVDADPPATYFKWRFNNSGETLDVPADRYDFNGSVSTLKYTPVADLDYGTLSCVAVNSIGHQAAPCIFQMVAAGKPQPVGNCTLSNLTSGAAEVICEAGFDGGLPQHFLLEVYSDSEDEPRYNLSSQESAFTVMLEPDVTFRLEVFAANAKGRSTPVTLAGVRMRDAEKRTANGADLLPLSPWLGAAAGAALSAFALAFLLALRARRARDADRAPAQTHDKQQWPPSAAPVAVGGGLVRATGVPVPPSATGGGGGVAQMMLDSSTDDRDPDVIPANYEPPPVYSRTWGAHTAKDHRLPLNGGPRHQYNQNPSSAVGRSCSGELLHRMQPPPLADGALMTTTTTTALNVQAFKEKILDTRLPESCV